MKKTKMAIMYDFDKTLSPKDMQEFRIIESFGYEDTSTFWKEVREMALDKKMDSILTYMYYMNLKANGLTKDYLVNEGKYIELFKGVETWFDRINKYALANNVELEHYIISSGIQEIIEGTSIAKNFKKIYACSFMYGADGKAMWTSRVVNYTTKTQYIFRIHKGVLDECNDADLNRWTPSKTKYIKYENMVYIGDGLTDVPCMKVVNQYNGYTVAVYHDDNSFKMARELVNKKRCKFKAAADYSVDSQMEKIMQRIIDEVDARAQLNRLM
jgi:2-hydroxy-3-keto-5-methylthiopentenyl-1-phosphate phosphatase